MPSRPLPTPLMVRFFNTTWDVAGALTMTPVTRDARMPPRPGEPPSMVMDLVIVTAPKPPGSRASISPPVAVLLIAPANVLHGAVRLQGLASLPTPDTQVRVAWAWATVAVPRLSAAPTNTTNT